MSQGSDDSQDMRPEYDIRGGVRGKYFERYTLETGTVVCVSFEESPFVAKRTTSTPSVGVVTRAVSYPPFYPSPRIQIAGMVHAGQDSPR